MIMKSRVWIMTLPGSTRISKRVSKKVELGRVNLIFPLSLTLRNPPYSTEEATSVKERKSTITIP